MSTLATERLVLRMFRESDLDAYAAICGDLEIMRYLAPSPMTRAEAWRNMAMVLGHWQLRGYGLWAVEERDRGCWPVASAAGVRRAGRGWKSAGCWAARFGGAATPPKPRERR